MGGGVKCSYELRILFVYLVFLRDDVDEWMDGKVGLWGVLSRISRVLLRDSGIERGILWEWRKRILIEI